MSVEVLIQHHPARAALLPQLLEAIPGARAVEDPDPNGYRSPWRTYRRCLLEPVETTHRLILQDDVTLCENFLDVLPDVVAARPDHAIVLFVGGVPLQIVRAMEWSCDRDMPFAEIPTDIWIPAVAVVWPTAMCAPIVEWADAQNWPVEFHADDEILGRATNALRYHAVATVPSLVQHEDMVESVVAKRRAWRGEDRNRVAWCFVEGDPRRIGWR